MGSEDYSHGNVFFPSSAVGHFQVYIYKEYGVMLFIFRSAALAARRM